MKKDEKGFALLAAIFVVIVFAILGIVAVSLMSGENILALRDYNSIRAFHLAGAGLRYTITASLAADTDWRDNTGFSKNLYPGYFTVEYVEPPAKKRCKLKVTGVVTREGGDISISRSITVILKKGNPSPFDYGIYANNPESKTLYVKDSANIYGDFYYNGPVDFANKASLYNGILYSPAYPVFETNWNGYFASWEAITVIDPPSFETSYYDTLLTETTRAATSEYPYSSTTHGLSGATEYYTRIEINNHGTVVGPGTLVATTGDFKLSGGGAIGDGVTVIVSKESNLGQSSTVGTDFNLISNGSITVGQSLKIPADAILFSKNGDITFGNKVIFWGSILAPNGTADTGYNQVVVNGIMYAKEIYLRNSSSLNGSAVVNQVGYFQNTSTVTYDPSKFPASFPPGFNISTNEAVTIVEWRENF